MIRIISKVEWRKEEITVWYEDTGDEPFSITEYEPESRTAQILVDLQADLDYSIKYASTKMLEECSNT
jgi:hypothetical protein